MNCIPVRPSSGSSWFALRLSPALIFISVAGVFIGMDPNFAFYLVAISNASSGIGRMLSGALASRFRLLNVMAVFMILPANCTYIWPVVNNPSWVHCHYGFLLVGTCLGLNCISLTFRRFQVYSWPIHKPLRGSDCTDGGPSRFWQAARPSNHAYGIWYE